MTEKARFTWDSRLYLGTTSNPLLVEGSVLLGVYLIKESVEYLGPIWCYDLNVEIKILTQSFTSRATNVVLSRSGKYDHRISSST